MIHKTLRTLAAAGALAFPAIAAEPPSITTWRLDSADVRSMSLPGIVFATLERQRGVEYPDTQALLTALERELDPHPELARIASGIVRTDLKLMSETASPEIDSFEIRPPLKIWMDSACIADFRRLLITKAGLNPVPKPFLEQARRLVGVEFPTSDLLHAALRSRLVLGSGRDTVYDRALRGLVEAHAAKRRPVAVASPPRWSGEGCGCSRASTDDGVYGFYLAGASQTDSDSMIERIDFEVLRRIEYFGLTFDRGGELVQSIAADSSDAFLREARAHGTRVDWVVTQTDPGFWSSVTPSERTRMFRHLREQILSLLGRPSNSFWERAKARAPFSRNENFGWGDGVTLFFPVYPSSRDAILAFDSLYRGLLEDLAASRPGAFHLNLAFSVADLPLKEGIGSSEHIVRLLGILDSIHPELPLEAKPSRILILMDPRNEQSHRLIQRHIDETFSSDIRRRIQRSLVPVLFPQTRSVSELRGEVAYFRDTYSGMGVWPLPMHPTPERPAMTAQDSLSDILWEQFATGEPEPRQSGFSAFLCVHRWPLRLAFLVAVFAAVVAGLCFLARKRKPAR